MGKKISFCKIIGLRFRQLTVIRQVAPHITNSGYKHRVALCRCDCGVEKDIQVNSILTGKTTSCGCEAKRSQSRMAILRNTSHGGYGTSEYSSWVSMKKRCNSATNPAYKYYGGRGISVCDRWVNSFSNFLEDMGSKPSNKHSLDRIDVNGCYNPSNCKWSTQKEQCRNQRTNVIVCYSGENKTLAEWAELNNIGYKTLYYRICIAKWSENNWFKKIK